MLALLLYIHAHGTHSSKHALNKSSSASVWCAFGIWVEKRGESGSCPLLSEVFFFFMFSFRNVKVAAQGHYCVSEEKTPLGWFKGRSNEMSYIEFMYLYELLFGLWCDTVVAFFIVWHFYIGKNIKCKAGKFALYFLFRSRWAFFQPSIQHV